MTLKVVQSELVIRDTVKEEDKKKEGKQIKRKFSKKKKRGTSKQAAMRTLVNHPPHSQNQLQKALLQVCVSE